MTTPLLTVNEACKYLRISRATIYRHLSRGELPHLTVGKRIRFRVSELDAYLERDRTTTSDR